MASGFLAGKETAIVAVSVLNVCLLVTTAFYKKGEMGQGTHSALRMKLGYLAILLALCSQILFWLMLLGWWYRWVPFDPGVNSLTHLEARLSNVGGLLSTVALFTALFGSGVRRHAGIWVGITTFCFWSYVSVGAALQSLFR